MWGSGDCTFVVTPDNKSILIDGGGEEFSNYDVRKTGSNAISFK